MSVRIVPLIIGTLGCIHLDLRTQAVGVFELLWNFMNIKCWGRGIVIIAIIYNVVIKAYHQY